MRTCLPTTVFLFVLACGPAAAEESNGQYRWLPASQDLETIAERFTPPSGFVREDAAAGSYAAWLRGLQVKPGCPDVRLHDGTPKGNQKAQEAVLDIDVGREDLQQCADAVMRLRAEYLFAQGRLDDIHFNFTSGDEARYTRYRDGWRARIKGNDVSWVQSAPTDSGYGTFRDYLKLVFMYAGTASLEKELTSVDDPGQIAPGDVFIQGGFPGHAVIVVDVAVNAATGAKVFLLAQSYMPAQEIHVLRNPASTTSPWYSADIGDGLDTPEWDFTGGDLRRFGP